MAPSETFLGTEVPVVPFCFFPEQMESYLLRCLWFLPFSFVQVLPLGLNIRIVQPESHVPQERVQVLCRLELKGSFPYAP